MMDLTPKADEVFARDLYATQTTGVKLEMVKQDYARCTVELQLLHRNAMGGVMGGVMFTLADLAFAAAANSHCIEAEEPLSWVSTDSNIHFIAQPSGNLLIAETQCVKRSRTSCLFLINIHDEKNNIMAVVTTSGRRITLQNT